MDQSQTPLVDRLQYCADRSTAPFHTPGHKKGQGAHDALVNLLGQAVFRADLPELPELDNLFVPEGVLQTAQDLAALAFGADRTWFLANGSTAGILAAILATCGPGDKLILPRNIHLSAINGLILSGAVPIFLTPEYDAAWGIAHGVTEAAVSQALLEHPDAKAVMLLSPTYYGVCADVGAIAQRVHQAGCALLVDEAHGAHFAFHPDLPRPALAAGADLVVQSTHKTLGALTQGAMVHTQGHRVCGDRLSQALQIVQSTSPSYLLLASLDAARQQMATQGQSLMAHALQLAAWGRSRITQIPGITVFNPPVSPGVAALDPTRLTLSASGLGLDGFTADTLLHEQWGVTVELPSLQNLTLIISLGNTLTDMERLVAGLTALAQQSRAPAPAASPLQMTPAPPQIAPLSPRAAYFSATETIPMTAAIDRISADLVCPYPPGIPVLMPGEIVTSAAIAHIQAVLTAGGIVSGCCNPDCTHLRVVKP